ncbi:MAG TPA: IS1595 family transposase [Desulfobacterales bacterium]|nr:IS1595 family transposase [Desulfobacterales bacterium]
MPEISLLEWQERYGTETACAAAPAKIRWPKGFMCPKCSHDRAYYVSKRKVYECSACHYQVSVTAGTLFHSTKQGASVYHIPPGAEQPGVNESVIPPVVNLNVHPPPGEEPIEPEPWLEPDADSTLPSGTEEQANSEQPNQSSDPKATQQGP